MARGAEVKRIILRGLRRRAFGQSLVEFAVALPILLFIIAGIVEVGNIFIQRNRAALVARETTRYVATGGEDNDALVISEQTVEQAFGGEIIAFDAEHLNIYIIHATVNATGDAIIDDGDLDNCSSEDDFCETHIYPTQQYYDDNFGGVDQDPHSGWTSAQVYERLSEISTGGGTETIPAGDLEDLKIAATVVQYNTTTVLNLPIFPQTDGGIPLNEITIMRQEATIAEAAGAPTDGCSAYPIAVSADAFAGAGQGDVRTLTYGTSGPLHFSYLLWNDDYPNPGARLEASLGGDQVPSAKRGVVEYPATHPPPLANTKDPDYGYIDDSEVPPDTALHKGDPALRNTNPGGANAMSMMTDHIVDERAIRILEFDSYDGTSFNISGVIVVEIVSLSDITGTMEMEFVRRDNSCGN